MKELQNISVTLVPVEAEALLDLRPSRLIVIALQALKRELNRAGRYPVDQE
jgi:hypothetical protein